MNTYMTHVHTGTCEHIRDTCAHAHTCTHMHSAHTYACKRTHCVCASVHVGVGCLCLRACHLWEYASKIISKERHISPGDVEASNASSLEDRFVSPRGVNSLGGPANEYTHADTQTHATDVHTACSLLQLRVAGGPPGARGHPQVWTPQVWKEGAQETGHHITHPQALHFSKVCDKTHSPLVQRLQPGSWQ